MPARGRSRMLRAMKRLPLRVFAAFALPLFCASLTTACDEDKKKEELVAKTEAQDAAVQVPETPPAFEAPSAAPKQAEAPAIVECAKGDELTLTDPDLEAELRIKLAKPKGPIKASELAKIKSLNLTRKASLDALDPCVIPKLVNLKDLYLGPGKLRDLSPIANLVHLESLRASINEVSDLAPLEKLTSLDRLDLGRTHVRDLSVLEKLVNVTELQLDDTQVSDIGPLAKMKKLEKLSIKHTNVTDVSPLKDLRKLKFVYIEGCAISNLDTLKPLTSNGTRIMTK